MANSSLYFGHTSIIFPMWTSVCVFSPLPSCPAGMNCGHELKKKRNFIFRVCGYWSSLSIYVCAPSVETECLVTHVFSSVFLIRVIALRLNQQVGNAILARCFGPLEGSTLKSVI